MKPVDNLSIIMPVYNGAEFVEAAIMSVLNQSHLPKEYEIIIIDDGSNELNIKQYAKIFYEYFSHNINYYRFENNRGIAAARNYGIKLAVYNHLAFIDQDDTWAQNKLEIQNEYIKSNPSFDYCLGHQEFNLYNTATFPKWFKPEWALAPQKGYVLGTMIIEKEMLLDIGLLQKNLKYGTDDVDWFARAKNLHKKELIVPETLLYRKIHNNNASQKTLHANQELLRVIKQKLNQEEQCSTLS